MKKRLTGYTFDASAQTVVHASFSDVTLAGIQLITNVTDGLVIYNFADATKGGTLSTDTLTLEYDTTSMSDTDELMILVEDGSASVAVSGTVTATVPSVDAVGEITNPVAVTNAGLTELAAAINGSSQMDVNLAANGIGIATAAKQDTIIGHLDGVEASLTTIAGDTTDIEAAVELLDDTVATLGTDTYTETTSKGITIGAVRRDADTTLVGTTNEFSPLQVDANGRLKVEAFSGETLPVSVASIPSHAVTNAGTFATQVDGAALTALQLINDTVATLGTTTYTEASTKGNVMGAVRRDANTSLVDTTNEVAPLQVNATGELKVAQIQALPAGNNNIGDIDVNTLPVAFNTGTRSATTQRVTVATDDIVPVAGTIAHDGIDSGNPVKIGGKAVSTAPTAVAANDRVDAFFDLQGRQIVAQKAATGTQTTVASSASNVTLLASNANRLGAILYNDSTAICYVRLAATATSSNFSYKMMPDSTVEIPFGYTGIIDGIWASATGNMRVTELT